jgi:two-component system response regulator
MSFEQVEILLVEDSDTDAEVTIRALKKANLGNRLVWVKDGAEALELLLGPNSTPGGELPQTLRLVLLDIKMPKVDGLEVLRRLREHDPGRRVPIVMMTSSAEEADLARSYALGVNSYLVKPIDFARLADAVARLGFYWLVMNKRPAQTD